MNMNRGGRKDNSAKNNLIQTRKNKITEFQLFDYSVKRESIK